MARAAVNGVKHERYGNGAVKHPPSAQQMHDYLDRLHQWFRKHHIAISEDPHDRLWKLNHACAENGDNKEDLQEIMRHFNGMNNAYLLYIHPGSSQSQQVASKTFYAHRDWLEQHGMKVCLCSQGFWVEDEEGHSNTPNTNNT